MSVLTVSCQDFGQLQACTNFIALYYQGETC